MNPRSAGGDRVSWFGVAAPSRSPPAFVGCSTRIVMIVRPSTSSSVSGGTLYRTGTCFTSLFALDRHAVSMAAVGSFTPSPRKSPRGGCRSRFRAASPTRLHTDRASLRPASSARPNTSSSWPSSQAVTLTARVGRSWSGCTSLVQRTTAGALSTLVPAEFTALSQYTEPTDPVRSTYRIRRVVASRVRLPLGERARQTS